MVWKRNSLLLFSCCVIALFGQNYIQTDETGVGNESTAGPLHPAGQQVFQQEPLSGKTADTKAMEERVKDVNYAELPPDAPKNTRFKSPNFKPPGNILLYKDLIFWAAVLILVGMLVFLIFKSGKRKRYTKRTALAGPAEWLEAWNLDAQTLETDLQDAVEAGQYRWAIRLLYLKNLKQLIDNDLVKPSPEKTNRQYGEELQKAGLQALFGNNTRVYETVWYGEATPDSQQYRKLAPLFHEMYERSRR